MKKDGKDTGGGRGEAGRGHLRARDVTLFPIHVQTSCSPCQISVQIRWSRPSRGRKRDERPRSWCGRGQNNDFCLDGRPQILSAIFFRQPRPSAVLPSLTVPPTTAEQPSGDGDGDSGVDSDDDGDGYTVTVDADVDLRRSHDESLQSHCRGLCVGPGRRARSLHA